MSLKKSRYFSIFGITLLNVIFHFIYELSPNTLFSIFFPVNESIFEHMKMLFSSTIFYSLIDYIILLKNKVKFTNLIFSYFVGGISNILISLFLWLPLYYLGFENLFITLIIMIVSIILTQFIIYKILSLNKSFKVLNILAFISIIVVYILFAYFTYNPLYNDFFYDPISMKYGLYNYEI